MTEGGSMSDIYDLIADYERKEAVIRQFFQEESWYCGGPIPDDLLCNDRNVFLLSLAFEDAIDIGHASVAKKGCLAREHPELDLVAGRVSKYASVKLFPKILGICAKRRIPQNFIGGILLIYLEICERVPLLLPEINAEKSNQTIRDQ